MAIQNNEKLEEIIKEQMDTLEKYVGKEVKIYYLDNGNLYFSFSQLKKFERYGNIVFDGDCLNCNGKKEELLFPLIGFGSAIVKIKNMDNKTLYYNPLVTHFYDSNSSKELYDVVVRSIGKDALTENARGSFFRKSHKK